MIDRFGDNAKAKFIPYRGENFQAGLAKSLKAIRRSARLVSAAAEKPRAGFFHCLSNRESLLAGFNRAGSGDNPDGRAAESNIAKRRRNSHHRIFLLDVAA